MSLPQQRLDLLQQPRQIDRLGIEVIAPRGERLLAVAGHRIGREGNDGNVAGLPCGLDLPRGLPAIEHRKAEIHQYDVGPLACGELHAARAVAGDHHAMPLTLQAALEDEDVVLVVFHVQDLHARISWLLACRPRSIERGSIRLSSNSSWPSSEAFFRITRST